MNIAVNTRLIKTKAILWFLVGIAAMVAVFRFTYGLGVTTALTDTTPWGMWIGFDVLAGVALAAGGFVVAAAVYIFGRDRYHVLIRPAILTAFLGYLAVIFGLLVDLGRPWNLWRPIFFHNVHSPLFEVAMCVMLYTTVLALEFAPVVLERFAKAAAAVRFLRKATLPLVITGIALSTLHQSSLGTLFLLTEARMHPLWYSPILPLLFLVSAIGLGLGMVTLESVISSWLYRRQTEWSQLAGLTKAAAVVLGVYLVLRLGDLVIRGTITDAFSGSGFAVLFWIEISLSAVVPILLFTLPKFRGARWAIGWGALLTVSGFILHRADVGGISHIAITGEKYLPALSEIMISLGVVSGLGLIFLFFVENLNVWEEKPAQPDRFTPPAIDPFTNQFIRSPWLGGGQRAALALVFGAIIGLALMEVQVAGRQQLQASPVRPARNVMLVQTPRANGLGSDFQLIASTMNPLTNPLTNSPATHEKQQTGLLLDSGGAGGFVMFAHGAHQERLGGKDSCARCHHRNVPLDIGTPCTSCHQDMYKATDTFNHQQHVLAEGGDRSCQVCHQEPSLAKTRDTAKACDECHRPVSPTISLVKNSGNWTSGVAPGYREAMHDLCIDCHKNHEQQHKVAAPYLSECRACHRAAFRDRPQMLQQSGHSLATAMVK